MVQTTPLRASGFAGSSPAGITYTNRPMGNGGEMAGSIESEDGVVCPYCGHLHEETEELDHVITYWGESEVRFQCSDCDMAFEVQENVTRAWESRPCVQPDVIEKLKEGKADG